MSLQAPDRSSLRQKIKEMLEKNIPKEGLSSDDPRFKAITGMDTKSLKADWAKGVITTSCNAFLGWFAREVGVMRGSVLAKGVLDISKADNEVPGCWVLANTGEAIEFGVHPGAGDFYSAQHQHKGWVQKYGHVGIVFDFDEAAQQWTLVEGGQGGPKSGLDFIKWNTKKFDRTYLNGWVDTAFYVMPNGPE